MDTAAGMAMIGMIAGMDVVTTVTRASTVAVPTAVAIGHLLVAGQSSVDVDTLAAGQPVAFAAARLDADRWAASMVAQQFAAAVDSTVVADSTAATGKVPQRSP